MDSFDAFDPFDLDELDDLEPNEEAETTSVSPRRLIILWLLAAGLLVALVPLSMMSKAIQEESAVAAVEIEKYETEPQTTPTAPLELQPLLATLDVVRNEVVELGKAESVVGGVLAPDVPWPDVIAAVNAFDADLIRLVALNQDGRQITLEGRAVNDTVIADYAQMLELSGVFSRVLVKSITLIEPGNLPVSDAGMSTPMPTVQLSSGTLMAATALATSAVGLRDPYEVDDFEPGALILAKPQRHTFYPIYDLDSVKFLAKRGRTYRVYTTDLDSGVDTRLSVEVGGRVYANDDVRVGTLDSEVIVTQWGSDAYAVVKIGNRGLYGPDMGYSVVVEELLPTPTPTVPPTPAPTSTSAPQPAPALPPAPSQPTSAPTATPQPLPTDTPTPTATPDTRDAYEPDEMVPRPIALDEVQFHSFHSDLDADRLMFLAKAGRRYRISTSGLATGVDTVLSVSVGESHYTSDDRDWGDLASEIVFDQTLPYDAIAEVSVANRGQSGSAASYRIMLQVLEPDPTATPTQTPTPTATATAAPVATATPTPAAPSTTTASANQGLVKDFSRRRLPGLARLRFQDIHVSDDWGHGAVEFVIVLELREGYP